MSALDIPTLMFCGAWLAAVLLTIGVLVVLIFYLKGRAKCKLTKGFLTRAVAVE